MLLIEEHKEIHFNKRRYIACIYILNIHVWDILYIHSQRTTNLLHLHMFPANEVICLVEQDVYSGLLFMLHFMFQLSFHWTVIINLDLCFQIHVKWNSHTSTNLNINLIFIKDESISFYFYYFFYFSFNEKHILVSDSTVTKKENYHFISKEKEKKKYFVYKFTII